MLELPRMLQSNLGSYNQFKQNQQVRYIEIQSAKLIQFVTWCCPNYESNILNYCFMLDKIILMPCVIIKINFL